MTVTVRFSNWRVRVKEARCIFCGGSIGMLRQIGGEKYFCGGAHREAHNDKLKQFALSRLVPTSYRLRLATENVAAADHARPQAELAAK